MHGLYLLAGFGLFILLKRVKWLLNWRLYIGILISLLCVVPIVYWNMQNHFITYQFHSERVTHHHIEWDSLLRELLGEFAYQNPIVFILIIVSGIYFIKNKTIFFSLANTWLLCMGLPMILLFWGIALFNPTLPHWSGPGYIPLFFIGAQYLEIKSEEKIPSFIKSAGLFLMGLIVFATILVRWAPVNFGSNETENYGEYSPALDLSGWSDFSKSFSKMAAEDIESGNMGKHSPIIINKWFPGGHLQFYTARQAGLQIVGIGNLENKMVDPLHPGQDAYCIVPSNVPADPQKLYKNYFTVIEPPVVFEQRNGDKIIRYFYVYRMKNCKHIPISLL